MSLIEQLGGYEQAKAKADELDYDLNNLEFLGGGSAMESMYERLDSIKKSLLEYRRENNIYEGGDLVVGLTSKTDEIFQIETTSNKLGRKGKKTYAVTFVGKEGLLVGLQYRHATDEEIKQGYRNSTGK